MVIGMPDSVGDEAAIEFARGFYFAAGWGLSIQQCFDEACARAKLAVTDNSEDDTNARYAHILTKETLYPQQVFFVSGPSR